MTNDACMRVRSSESFVSSSSSSPPNKEIDRLRLQIIQVGSFFVISLSRSPLCPSRTFTPVSLSLSAVGIYTGIHLTMNIDTAEQEHCQQDDDEEKKRNSEVRLSSISIVPFFFFFFVWSNQLEIFIRTENDWSLRITSFVLPKKKWIALNGDFTDAYGGRRRSDAATEKKNPFFSAFSLQMVFEGEWERE